MDDMANPFPEQTLIWMLARRPENFTAFYGPGAALACMQPQCQIVLFSVSSAHFRNSLGRIQVAPQFAVILRQASFVALVMNQKSPLPSQKTRLPRLTTN
jgi:hypothetical protein